MTIFVYFQNLLPAVDHTSEQSHLQQSFIPVHEHIYDIPKFTDNEYRYLLKCLSRGSIVTSYT